MKTISKCSKEPVTYPTVEHTCSHSVLTLDM